MLLNFTYEGTHYCNFTRDAAISAGVPSDFIDTVITASAWSKLREKRQQKLSECDWTVLPDAPLTADQKTAWKAYRDALRDLPATLEAQNITPEIALNDDSYFPQKPE